MSLFDWGFEDNKIQKLFRFFVLIKKEEGVRELIEHYGNFHSVGQGLFISGEVRFDSKSSFSYIYDCGTEKNQQFLKKHIKEAVDRLGRKSLDILFLSHLHWDHVSGLSMLLKSLQPQNGPGKSKEKTIKIKKVVLPYLYPAERVVVMATASQYLENEEDLGWYTDFLARPGEFLRKRGVEDVFFVRGGDSESPERNEPNSSPNNSQERQEQNSSLPVDVHKNMLSEEKFKNIKNKESEVRGDVVNNNLNLINSRSILRVYNWIFYLFNKNVDSKKLDNFLEEFKRVTNKQALYNFLHCKDYRNYIRKAYENLVGRSRLNDSSLAVLSACDTSSRWISKFCGYAAGSCVLDRCCSPRRCLSKLCDRGNFCSFCHSYLPGMARAGFVYTGDLPVNKVWSELSEKFQLKQSEQKTLVLAYQVPHHGSKENWHAQQAKLEGDTTYVVSAGISNRYGHPATEVLRDVAVANKRLVWVNDGCSFPNYLRIER